METTYDKIIKFLLDNWVIATIAVIFIVIIYFSKLVEGIKTLYSLFNPKHEFVSEYADETITFDVKLRSQDFDIVKIHATTHSLGVRAEKEWINKNYPGYENNMQLLDHIITNDGKRITFDILPIHKGNKTKNIYFDITDFYNGASVAFTGNVNKYAEQKIRDIYGLSDNL